MIRSGLLLASAMLLVACGPKTGDAEIKSPTAAPILQPVGWNRAPVIGQFVDAAPKSDCTFFADGHVFDYDDKSTWKFVFLTVFGEGDLPTDYLNGQIKLNDRIRTVESITSRPIAGGEVREYRTIDAPAALIEIDMLVKNEGVESKSYVGEIRVTQPEGVAPVSFYGDCGV